MPKIRLIERNGTEHVLEAQVGMSVMQTALGHRVPSIVGDRGGCCSCGTCHVYVETNAVKLYDLPF